MTEIEKRSVKTVETVLRDAHRSLLATRMSTEQMLPIIDKMNKVGYYIIECRGGATFDPCFRFLKGDLWGRLRKLRGGLKNTKLQMLFCGQNILGYNHYTDGVVEYFVQKSIPNGIDIIRIFDCLSNVRNLEAAIRATNKGKEHAQVTLRYTLDDAYTLDYWKGIARRIEDMGTNPLCIEDTAGLLTPYATAELIRALKEGTRLPIDLYTHYTSGVASMACLKTAEADCKIIGCAMSPLALGTSQPATEVMVETFRGTPYGTGYDRALLAGIVDHFQPIRDEAFKSDLLSPRVLGASIKALQYQVPGGILSNLIKQLKDTGQENKYRKVLEGVPRVRRDFGKPPLVAPSSQIVGARAVMNVTVGEHYKMVPKESRKIVLSKFGQTAKPSDAEVQRRAIGDETPITYRPADLIPPQLPQFEKECVQWKQQDEDVLNYALFPAVTEDFFEYRATQQTKVGSFVTDKENRAYPV